MKPISHERLKIQALQKHLCCSQEEAERNILDGYYIVTLDPTRLGAVKYTLKGFHMYVVKACLALCLTLTPSMACASNDIVAVTIAAEACSEGERGMQAVANTIRNRAVSRGMSARAVVTERNQYYGATAKNRLILYGQCRAIADKLSKNINTIADITGGAEYFLLPGERVRAWHGKRTVTIGKHTFYKEAKT